MYLRDRADSEGKCWPGIKTIASVMRLSRSTVKRALIDLERNLPQSNKAENADMRGAYAISGRGGIAHEPAVDKPRRRGGKQMKTYGEEDL